MDFYSDEYSLADKEMLHGYYKFFTLLSLIKGHRISIQNSAVETLSVPVYFNIAKEILEVESPIKFMEEMLQIDPSLAKSKILLTFANECIAKRAEAT